ncbi:flavoprotein [Virgisporangium aliadipatigenens]|uniref:Flavoprotein n=1 Tax=Virgisporangium aliadipatigenens TaxID=741659 RepID=A0A8J4DQG2_9ACTN|nr:flavoprotein [Virgisporangium aliadipatigenens]GIJ47005.1 flavoprotein [Virgisporangium aliadipatigenens]
MTGRRGVLYLVVCGSPASRGAAGAVRHAQDDGWDVCVVSTPDGLKWLDVPEIAELTGHPVRHRYKFPGDPDVLPPADAVLVAPATVNTVNKWAAGIADTLALGLIVEGLGKRLPIVAVPFTNEAMARHPAFPRSVAALREWGVTVLYGDGEIPTFPPGTGGSIVDTFPWRLAVDAISARVSPS